MFKKATKKGTKLRLALFGVSGGGKTYSALRIATGLGGKIALIDTERKSASKYADRFDFDVCELEKASINNLLLTMNEAKGYDVLIIDSLSHAWNELLEEVDKLATAKYGNNSWRAWSEGTPKQKKLIDAILSFGGHVIVTMRADTNWTTTINDKGKVQPVRIGEAPRQGKGIEYEFDMLMQFNENHIATVIKDRTGKYQDECIDKPDEKFGRELAEWLESDDIVAKDEPKQVDEPTITKEALKEEVEKVIEKDENKNFELILQMTECEDKIALKRFKKAHEQEWNDELEEQFNNLKGQM